MNKKDGRTKVLFVCLGNTCRSLMAEAIARRDASDTIEAYSAGLTPMRFVAEITRQTLQENEYSEEGLYSKGISRRVWKKADIVINMSGHPRELAFREYAKVRDWRIEDPYADPRIYQEVFEKIRLLVADLAQECRRKNAARMTGRRAPAARGSGQLIKNARQFGEKLRRDWDYASARPAGRGAFVRVSLLVGLIVGLGWMATQRNVRTEEIPIAQKTKVRTEAPLQPKPVQNPASLPVKDPSLPPKDAASAAGNDATAPSVDTVAKEESPTEVPVGEARDAAPAMPATPPATPAHPPVMPLSKAASQTAKNVSAHVSKDNSARAKPRKQFTMIAVSAHNQPLNRPPQTQNSGAAPTAPQLEAKLVQPADLGGLSSNVAGPARPKAKESSIRVAKPAAVPTSVAGTVEISTDPYPSLRIPEGRGSKKQMSGASLQLGHLVSRVEPIYPEEAKQQGIQGTVKLHAIIDKNGAVEKLQSANNSPILVAAAVNAVQQWRYSETLLGGKSVETEQNIAVTFRLPSSSAPTK